MAGLSKTARASVQAGEGAVKRPIYAWVFRRNGGKRIQTRAYITFYSREDLEGWWDLHGGEGYYKVTAEELGKNTVRR